MKYLKRITLWIPKPLLDELDRVLLKDGRRRAEVVRGLISNFIRESRGAAGGAAGGAAHGATR